MPHPHQIHHTPPNGLGHARPVPPHAALKRPVRVEQEERQHVDVPGLCDGVLPPRLEHVARQRAPERLSRRGVLVRRHGRHDGHLIVQVRREVRRKRVHDPAEGPGVIRRRVGGVEECLEGREPRQEGFCDKISVSMVCALRATTKHGRLSRVVSTVLLRHVAPDPVVPEYPGHVRE